jgi:hypothetical protein
MRSLPKPLAHTARVNTSAIWARGFRKLRMTFYKKLTVSYLFEIISLISAIIFWAKWSAVALESDSA